MKGVFVLCLLLGVASPAAAAAHHCAADARAHAEKLLELHGETDASYVSIDDTVTQLAPIKALKGNGHLDVLEVWGHIYKADYRMRFIYAQIEDSCALMGQEVLEASNPY